ncbi:MAG TPA: radical SAM protein [Terriglobales bacterium]|nr:radical SAM protein [Terriglobales bacterium]
MNRFVSRRRVEALPRLPLKGSLDLTYRCNNDCRHCWLRLAPEAPEAALEIPFEEIRRLVDEAREAGCRQWTISGGEPMLRPDFAEIFSYITARAAFYTLNTNGTLITPALARLMTRPGAKLVALYGATAEVHDRVTRRPGSFAALERGVALLRRAKAGFTVQVVPMRSNFHEYPAMVRLAESWSPSWRVGASWLFLSADGDPSRNRDIAAERLAPDEVLGLDRPERGEAGGLDDGTGDGCPASLAGGLYAGCLAGRRDFHVDPYGGLSFCGLVKDPGLRLDLRRMTFREAWDEGLPALAGKVVPGPKHGENCGSCGLRKDCRWCPVYAYLEHRDHEAKVEYLCALAGAEKEAKEAWTASHCRDYRIAGLEVRVEADLPITETTFGPKFEPFRVRDGRGGGDGLSIRHHFALPRLEDADLGREVYRRPPWAVYRRDDAWVYVGIYPDAADARVHRVIVFSDDHTRARVFNPSPDLFLAGGLDSLMLLPSDQIALARLLPFRDGAFVHAAGVEMNGRGLLFAGPSEAGKSTVVKMLRGKAKVLCDDRMIIRRDETGFRIHGTWSHGEIAEVSPGPAPAAAVLFLRQARENRLERMTDPRAALRALLPRLVRPLVTSEWWERVLALAGEIVDEVPCYEMLFDKSGRIVDALEELTR